MYQRDILKHMRILVYWCGGISAPFWVSNGVRQGGSSSPALFDFFMDNLSQRLKTCKTGCSICSILVNHLMYAEDLVVFSPSSVGLLKLLNVRSE